MPIHMKDNTYLKGSKNRKAFSLSRWEMRKAEGQEESKELRYPDLQHFGCWLLADVSLRLP